MRNLTRLAIAFLLGSALGAVAGGGATRGRDDLLAEIHALRREVVARCYVIRSPSSRAP